jgi:Uma2 family endonuclease
MGNVTTSSQAELAAGLPVLEAGDHLRQETFHQRYEAMPAAFRAELIGGFVVVPSPLSQKHGRYHACVIHWLSEYAARTPPAVVYDNTMVILGPESEPQPDACLIIDPHCGGQTRLDERDYVVGPPELIVEVASSSEAYDLHEKFRDYENSGVREYVVVTIRDQQIRWFCLAHGTYNQLSMGADHVYRSQVFPGLHLDADALLDLDTVKLLKTLQEGLAGPEHAAFVEKLQQQRASS